jgi:hypothetical protein
MSSPEEVQHIPLTCLLKVDRSKGRRTCSFSVTMTPMTEIYSGATYFGVPLKPYFGAYILMMVMFLGPTLAALGWALTAGQRRLSVLRVVRPFPVLDRSGEPISTEEEDRTQRTDRAA